MNGQSRGIPRYVVHFKGCFSTTGTKSGVLAEELELLVELLVELLIRTPGFCMNKNK